MPHIVLDLETTVKNAVGSNKGSAFCPENFVVLGGTLQDGVVNIRPGAKEIAYLLNDFTGLLVGQNLKFDLHWLRREGFNFRAFVGRGGKIWSCDIAEYVLSAQESKFASLDDLAPKYGGTLKDNRIKELWDAGVGTEAMDADMLAEYLKNDLLNTEKVYLGQVEAATKSGQLPLIEAMMEAALAVAEIEWNGMPIDLGELDTQTVRLFNAREGAMDAVLRELPPEVLSILNIGSPKQVSAILFGGTITYDEKVGAGTFKTGPKAGQPKFKNEERSIVLPRLFEPEPHWQTKTPGVYSVADDVLEALAARGSEFAKALRTYRELDKEYSTYAESLPGLIYPDGNVHPNLHQTSTNTGRLSSSEPNLQNQPTGSEIKRVFKSRFPNGRLVSLDFKQLEVIVLAYLSGDRKLREDILNGVDIHNATGTVVFPGRDMTKAERRTVKTVVFGLAYGGGAKTLAQQASISERLASDVITAFYSRYPEVKEYHQRVVREVEEKAEYAGDRVGGTPCRRSYLTGPTGRKYLFVEGLAPEEIRHKLRNPINFTPTKPKNYPVQGLATGDIVPMVLGHIFRTLCARPWKEKVRVVNTIHDSIVLDCEGEDRAEAASRAIQGWAQEAPALLRERFGIEFDLPLLVECSIGSTWYEVDQE